MELIKELKNRGILKDITNPEKLSKINKKDRVYIGFDPTAKSLHLGNYIQITILQRFKKAGYEPIAVLGGATGMIGDPSGRSEERHLQTHEQLNKNKSFIKKQLASFGLEVLDNYEFYKDMNILDFLREAGKLLNVNYMINKEVVKSRLNKGLSYTEFSYQLIQGWDFKELYINKNVKMQCGGSDQWGNITAGVEVIRKVVGDDNLAVGLTTNLLLDSNGNKFGKSTGGALWLDKSMCSPYKLYQYLINIADEDVERMLTWVTFLTEEQIRKIMDKHNQEPFKRFAQQTLAKEIITNIHSKEDLEIAIKLSDILFKNKAIDSLKEEEVKQLMHAIPTTKSSSKNIMEILVESGSCKSNREAREFIANKAISINGEVIENYEQKIPSAFNDKFVLIKRGKKNWFLVQR